MANKRIKGITIEIDGDTNGLQKALKSVDSTLRETSSQLRDIDKLLKLDPGNTDLLRQKQEALGKAIGDTESRLKTLKEAYNKATDPKDQDALQREIVETEQKLKSLENQAKDFGNVFKQQCEVASEKLKKVGDSVTDAGKSMTTKVTAPIVAGFTVAANEAIQWESAFTGVMKTVDETVTTTYDDISEGIKEIAKTTASSKTEIAGVAEVAGQLGISADNIVDFTKVMIELGDTTNLTAEEAATSLARIINITGDSSESVENLGSVIVALGNNFATSESEIVALANRLASAGKLAGLSTPQILGLSAAMSSVGIQAEAGGTAMTQTLTALEKEVSNFRAGAESNLGKIAEIAGMTSEEFANAWENKPADAITSFIAGLGNLDEKGESATMILDELGMSGIRQANMLKSLSLAADMVAESMDTANEAYEENNALSEEAEKRYGTTEAKISQMKEKLSEMAIEVGEKLMPLLEKLINLIGGFADWFSNLDDGTQQMIVDIGLVVAAIGPLLVGIGTLITSISTIISTIGLLAPAFEAIAVVLTAVFGASVGAVVVAIGLLIAAGVLLVKNWDEIKEFAGIIWEGLKEGWNNLCETISKKWEELKEKTKSTWENIKTATINKWEEIKEKTTTKAGEIKDKVVDTWETIKAHSGEALTVFLDTVKDKFNQAKEFVFNTIEKIKSFFNFKWELPAIKLPHFSVSGSANPVDWLTQGVPRINVEWYKKAQNTPYYFDSPSIIGVGDVPEVVVGADYFKNMKNGGEITNNIVVNATIQSDADITLLANKVASKIQLAVDKRANTWG